MRFGCWNVIGSRKDIYFFIKFSGMDNFFSQIEYTLEKVEPLVCVYVCVFCFSCNKQSVNISPLYINSHFPFRPLLSPYDILFSHLSCLSAHLHAPHSSSASLILPSSVPSSFQFHTPSIRPYTSLPSSVSLSPPPRSVSPCFLLSLLL